MPRRDLLLPPIGRMTTQAGRRRQAGRQEGEVAHRRDKERKAETIVSAGRGREARLGGVEVGGLPSFLSFPFTDPGGMVQ